MEHYSSMKKSKLIIISLISLSLTSCRLFNLFGKEKPTVRTNDFFTTKELSKYYIPDLPTLNETDNSRLEKYSSHLEGYFNVSNPIQTLKKYSTQTFDYLKSSGLSYGSMLQNASGWPQLDMFKSYECLKNTQTMDFYQIYGDRYAFFYEKDNQFFEVLVKASSEEIDNKTYNFLIEINKINSGIKGWTTEYEEVILTNDNKDEYIDLTWSVADNGISFVFTAPQPLYGYQSYIYRMNYTFRGETDYFDFNYQYVLMFSTTFEDPNYTYQEGDFVLLNTEIVGSGAIILKKGEGKLAN